MHAVTNVCAQKHRGCEEQILTVRLLIDIARKTKETLYIAFIDYEKAYDRLERIKFYKRLDQLGCGSKEEGLVVIHLHAM